jgi:hypothetical protein
MLKYNIYTIDTNMVIIVYNKQTTMKGYNMTKKDYIALANIIKTNGTIANLRRGITYVIIKGTFMNDLCEYLKKDNINFDEVKFREVTGEILNK